MFRGKKKNAIALFSVVMIAMMIMSLKADAKTMRREHDPIQVPGELLGAFHGKKLDGLRVYASNDGKFEQIIYQFDERLEDGTFIMKLGAGKNDELANGVLDKIDLMLFRIGDAGDKMEKDSWPVSDGMEIELEDPVDGGKSYCYLFDFKDSAPKRPDVDTVSLEHWDPWKNPELPFIVNGKTFKIEGLVNKIQGKYYKTAINKSYKMPKESGGTNVNILDGQRMRAFVELFFGKISIDANETNMVGGIDALTQGYIRGYGRQWLTIALPMGLKAPKIYSDVFTYDRIIVSPMELNIPFNPESIITRAGVEFGYDLNNEAKGMKFYSPNCMEGVVIDGNMTEAEKNISNEWVPWFLITGPQASLIFRVEIEPALMEQTKNTLTYIDDISQTLEPEDIPGAIGYTRTLMEIGSVKAGAYKFAIEWYFPPNFYKDGGYDEQMLQDFLNIKDAPVKINVDGKSAENKALNPPVLTPKR